MNKKISLITAFAFSLVIGQVGFATGAAPTSTSTTTPTTSDTMHGGMNGSMHKNATTTDKTADHSDNGCAEKMKNMLASLKLNDEQKAKIKAIREQTQASMKANRDQMKDIRAQISQLIQSDTMDESQLDSLINKKKELIGNMMKTKIMAKHQIYMLLNPQQKAQFQQMMKKWEENMMKHFKDC